MDRRTFVATLAGGLLAASFSAARAPNTPAQDRALEAWSACTTGPATARLDQIEAKGRIHFHYSEPSDGARMTACLREKAGAVSGISRTGDWQVAVMERRAFLGVLAGFRAAPLAAEAQPAKVARIGYLSLESSSALQLEAFYDGVRRLGYVDGGSIVIESRLAEGKTERLPALASQLVALKLDAIPAGANGLLPRLQADPCCAPTR
jgi:hypothetical protein